MRYVVTHDHTAHPDDLLSIGLVAWKFGMNLPVYRRWPKPEELNDKSVVVIDVGGEYNSAKSNWDHHQFSESYLAPDRRPDCTFSLLARSFDLEDKFLCTNWYRKLRWIDARGGFAWAKTVGLRLPIDKEVLSEPFSLGLRQAVEQYYGPSRPVDPALVDTLRIIFEGLLKHATKLHAGVVLLRQRAQVIELGGLKGVYVEAAAGDAFDEYFREVKAKPEHKAGAGICFTITRFPDGVWTLYREPDAPIDLGCLDSDPHIKLVHHSERLVHLSADTTKKTAMALMSSAIAEGRRKSS